MAFRISELLGSAVKTAFHDVAAVLEAAGQEVIKALGPELQTMVTADVSAAKQFASDAISIADSSLAQHHQAIAMDVEQGIDTEIGLLTGGLSHPFDKITNEVVDQFVNTAIAAAHNTGLSIKARLAVAAQQIPNPPPASTVQALNADVNFSAGSATLNG